ncbi:hypothetical protein Pcinc_015166 [Petrolisthes cinctipes]|uniref:GOLD domain-containing protein n=1 Tax=Petrolisthes cinctipes TaxID=88211 RepID=A0AAE1FZ02_PETCI|nr:hypothetical protein Pcinc_015166 [Petrolisthes cinctipes]
MKASRTWSALAVLIFCSLLTQKSQCREIEREMTVEVKAGREECFYEMVKAGETLDVEYQVIDGGQGDMDINFYVSGPSGPVLIQDFRRGEGSHRITMTEEADYRICWDNMFSHFNTKTVFFGIMIESDLDDDEDEDEMWGNLAGTDITAEEIYDMKIEDIKERQLYFAWQSLYL